MSLYETVTVIVALLGVVVASVSLVRTRRLSEQQSRLQQKQEELTDLQLRLLRREVQEQSRREVVHSDVRVSLQGPAQHARFVITNWGYGPARDVNLTITPLKGRSSPLVRGDYEDKLPISELLPGDRVALMAALTFGSGTTFDASWTWIDADGSAQSRQGRISLV